MQDALITLHERLAPAEEIFFTWLLRVVVAGTLVGCAWIDDAPPLDLAAMAVAIYVAVRVATQFPLLVAAVPFENRVLKAICAAGALVVLGLSFLSMVTFVEYLALSAVG